MGAAVIKPRHLTEKCVDEIVQRAQRWRVERGLVQLFFTGLRVLNFCIDVGEYGSVGWLRKQNYFSLCRDFCLRV